MRWPSRSYSDSISRSQRVGRIDSEPATAKGGRPGVPQEGQPAGWPIAERSGAEARRATPSGLCLPQVLLSHTQIEWLDCHARAAALLLLGWLLLALHPRRLWISQSYTHAGPLAEQLAAEIERLADRFPDAPRFPPHVTLVGGVEMGEQEILSAARQLAARLKVGEGEQWTVRCQASSARRG